MLEKIASFEEIYGVKLLNIRLARNASTNESEGWATAELSSEAEVIASIEVLHSQDCKGRPIRVQRALNKRKKAGSSDRYFLEDELSIKCNNCGQTGHRVKDCLQSAALTCHLCAGRDHEAGIMVFMLVSNW